MTGSEFISHLKNLALTQPELKTIPNVILTGENINDAEKEFGFQKDAACNFFLPKMTEHVTVLSLVKKILSENN